MSLRPASLLGKRPSCSSSSSKVLLQLLQASFAWISVVVPIPAFLCFPLDCLVKKAFTRYSFFISVGLVGDCRRAVKHKTLCVSCWSQSAPLLLVSLLGPWGFTWAFAPLASLHLSDSSLGTASPSCFLHPPNKPDFIHSAKPISRLFPLHS